MHGRSLTAVICAALVLAGCGASQHGSPRAALEHAAAAAAGSRQPSFGPGRFWYLRTLETINRRSVGRSRSTTQSWFGFDGSSRIRSPSPPPVAGSVSVGANDPDYDPNDSPVLLPGLFTVRQLASLPTGTGRLTRAITAGEHRLNDQNAAARRGHELLETAIGLLAAPVAPKVRAALYRVIATIPELRDDGSVHDPLGRAGTELSLGAGNGSVSLTFDPASGALLSTSLGGVLTETIVADGFSRSLATLPPGQTSPAGAAPAALLAAVSPHVGTPHTVFRVVQAIRAVPMVDELLGPATARCDGELVRGASPRLSGGAAARIAIDGLSGRGHRYRLGPRSIGRTAWCRGEYELGVTGVNGRQAAAFFRVR